MDIRENHQIMRCTWVDLTKPYYVKYHDEEWGVPVHDDTLHFEMLTLEGAQAGLSWDTVLKKREEYKKAFDNFNVKKIAHYSDTKVKELLSNPGIIRNRLKIQSTINNAKAFLEIQKEFGSFDKYIWQFVNNTPIINSWKTLSDLPAETPESNKISKDLKKRGMRFVGPTIIYAYMQAIGLVQDHTTDCFRYKELL